MFYFFTNFVLLFFSEGYDNDGQLINQQASGADVEVPEDKAFIEVTVHHRNARFDDRVSKPDTWRWRRPRRISLEVTGIRVVSPALRRFRLSSIWLGSRGIVLSR